MNGILVLAQKEFKMAFKDHIFIIITLLFLILSIVSVYIGSSTKHAEMQAYQDIVQMLKNQGEINMPTAPVIYPLSVLSNIITYVSMIGAVVAIFLGFDSFSGERNNGTLRLIATRSLYRDQIVTGKLLGGGIVIGTLLAIILIFNIGLFIVVSGMVPGSSALLRLGIFFLLAFIYMMLFYSTTLYFSIRTNDSSFSFMLMMIIWLSVSFVIPQLAESQKNFVFAMSAISQTAVQDTVLSKTISFASPSIQFQEIGNNLLQVIPETANIGVWMLITKEISAFLEIVAPSILMVFLSYRAIQKEEAL